MTSCRTFSELRPDTERVARACLFEQQDLIGVPPNPLLLLVTQIHTFREDRDVLADREARPRVDLLKRFHECRLSAEAHRSEQKPLAPIPCHTHFQRTALVETDGIV